MEHPRSQDEELRESPPLKPVHSRGYLPHWEAGMVAQAITFRLADALPQSLLESWRAELERLTTQQGMTQRRQSIETALDQGIGACHLRRPEIAQLAENALLYFDGARYKLHAWTIMPNHVHVLIVPLHGNSLSSIVHSWKSFTAKEANKRLGLSGAFWQEEYFDRMIRDEIHWRYAITYIEQNPVKAGLCSQAEDWPFGSASLGARASRPHFVDEVEDVRAEPTRGPSLGARASRPHFVEDEAEEDRAERHLVRDELRAGRPRSQGGKAEEDREERDAHPQELRAGRPRSQGGMAEEDREERDAHPQELRAGRPRSQSQDLGAYFAEIDPVVGWRLSEYGLIRPYVPQAKDYH